jgi:hypothetical protein
MANHHLAADREQLLRLVGDRPDALDPGENLERRCLKRSSTRPGARAPGAPNPTASSLAVSPRGSSSSASGFPSVSATSWFRRGS